MPKRRFDYSDMEYAIGEYITGKNAERNRDILRLYFLNGYSQERIAEIHEMSPMQIGRAVAILCPWRMIPLALLLPTPQRQSTCRMRT